MTTLRRLRLIAFLTILICGIGLGTVRHTGQWAKLYDALTVDECLKAIQDDMRFVP